MSKAVMLSVHPKWCELIASGTKTIEVRKNRPQIETPFKCYIYETKGKSADMLVRKDSNGESVFTYNNGKGKVIGEFVCDEITALNYDTDWGVEPPQEGYFLVEPYSDYVLLDFDPCLTNKELINYGKGKPLYGWHISDLKIYDKPREMGEFRGHCGKSCLNCNYVKFLNNLCDEHGTYKLSKPPQSWCYIEVSYAK